MVHTNTTNDSQKHFRMKRFHLLHILDCKRIENRLLRLYNDRTHGELLRVYTSSTSPMDATQRTTTALHVGLEILFLGRFVYFNLLGMFQLQILFCRFAFACSLSQHVCEHEHVIDDIFAAMIYTKPISMNISTTEMYLRTHCITNIP